MLKLFFGKKLSAAFVLLGLVSLAAGSFSHAKWPGMPHNLAMLMGMLAGAGSALAVVGALTLIAYKRATPEKRRQLEIERRDERNQTIQLHAFRVAGVLSAVFFVVAAFVLVGLGHIAPAMVVLGGLYVEAISLMVALAYYRKKL